MSRIATLLGLAALLLTLGTPDATAQSRTVTGTVTDANSGDTLPFVNVIIQGTTRGAATNIDGEYSIAVDGPDAVLVYRFLGYVEHVETVGSRSVIDVALAEDSNILDDVVVVGYGTQRRGDVTASVSTVDIDDANEGLISAPTDFLEGRVAGVNVIENGGEPGANVSVRIRGGTSITASNEPLYVIDGIPISNDNVTPGGAGEASNGPPRNPLTLINPNDIASMTVLKDASATAIYGSRGANGVVLITTKNGASGQVSVDYEGTTSFSSASNNYDVLTGDEYRSFVTQNASIFGAGALAGPDGSIDFNNTNSDFVDAIFRTAVSQSHNLSFGGGTPTTQYRASLSYLDQQGIVISSGLERVTARLNANNQLFDNKLRLGLNLTSALTDDDFVPANDVGGFEGGLFQNALQYRPVAPIYSDASGDGFYEVPNQRSFRNPVALAEQIDETARTVRTLGNISAELELVDGLTASLNVGGDRSVGTRRSYIPGASPLGEPYASATTNGGSGYRRTLERTSATLSTYLTYASRLGQDTNFDILGGYEYQSFNVSETSVQASGFVTDVTADDLLQSGALIQVNGNAAGPGTFSYRGENLLASFFTRTNLNYGDRYYLTGSLRYDGSSRFSEDNRYALFPAVSGAWRITEEPFFDGGTAVTDLRLRAGYGVVGNQAIGDYLFLPLLGANPANSAVLNGVIVPGYAPTQLANPDLQWEEKEEVTVGLDYRLLSDRLYGSVEFYRNTTNDLLLQVPILASVVSTQLQNVGSLRNTGVDLALDALLFENDAASFTLGFTFNTNQNEILDLGGATQLLTGNVSGEGQSNVQTLLLTPGEQFPVFYGFEWTGEFQNGTAVYNDYNPVDLDGDGVIGPLERELVGTTQSPDDGDRVKLGSPRPDFTYGIRLNGTVGDFGLRAFFRGEQGRELFNNTALVYGGRNSAGNRNFLDLDFPADESIEAARVYSSRYIEDASFLRLDQLTLDYRLGNVLPQIRNARVFVTGNNLFVITPYTGIDPEVNAPGASVAGISSVGVDYLSYPRARTFTIGVNLGL
ncbi:SusC/RagA family TonB-linked outer membrane protein [Rubrivirga sp. IMCC45206]|uniref:SusC/RagA family TonB-linked outer membrane protein n=1 Tax=Rubrivirga sp. IMCC45206 TaxID=3391614 RepID=UPI00398F949E